MHPLTALLLLAAPATQDASLPRLIEQLRSDEVEQRRLAQNALEKAGAPALPLLELACVEGDVEQAAHARRLIWRIVAGARTADRVAKLIPAVDGYSWEKPRVWTELFLEVGGERDGAEAYPDLRAADLAPLVKPALGGAAGDDDFYQILWNVTRRRLFGAIPAVMDLLRHSNPVVRAHAAGRLGELGALESTPRLVALLDDEETDVRRSASGALESMTARSAIPAITERLRHSNPEVRRDAANLLEWLRARTAIPALIGLLRDPAADVRRQAASSLARLSAVEAVDALIPLLQDGDEDVRLNATFALSDLGSDRAVPGLIELLDHPESSVRRLAVMQIPARAPAKAVALLLPRVKDSSADVRLQAMVLLGQLNARESIPAIIGQLEIRSDLEMASVVLANFKATEAVPRLVAMMNDETSRHTAAAALGRMGAEEAIPTLMGWMKQEATRPLALQVFSLLGDPKAVAPLIRCLDDEDPGVVHEAAQMLGGLQAKAAIPTLLRRLKTAPPHSRTAIVTALVRLGAPEGRTLARECLLSPESDVRQTAIGLLVDLDDRDSIPSIIAVLKDSNEWVRSEALDALGDLRVREAVPSILPLLTDAEAVVVMKAFDALEALGAMEAIPVIRRLLKDPSEDVRRYAVRAAGRFGDQEAVPALRALLKDPSPDIRRSVARALANLGAVEAGPDLLRLLDSETSSDRGCAAVAAGRLGLRDSIPRLVRLLRDEEDNVALAAAHALRDLDARECIPELEKLHARNESVFPLLVSLSSPAAARDIEDGLGGGFELNSVRRPDLWKRLAAKSYTRRPGDTKRQMIERVAEAAGLPLRWPSGGVEAHQSSLSLSQWHHTVPFDEPFALDGREDARLPLLRALELNVTGLGLFAVLEDDSIRLLNFDDHEKLWRQWRESQRKARR